MAIIDFILILTSSIGLTIIVVYSHLFEKIRDTKYKYLNELLSCPLCFGFWSGIFCYLLMSFDVKILLFGFTSSILSYLTSKLL